MSVLSAAALAVAPLSGAAAAIAGAPERVVVLGDSLSDTGNAGRFSNGPIWVETVATRLGAAVQPSEQGGTNFAVGGARLHGGAHSLRQQANRHITALGGQPIPAGTLYIVYGGGNDLLAAPLAPDFAALVPNAIASLRSVLEDLARRGARDVLVPNLPNVGYAPYVRMLGPEVGQLALDLTQQYNRALAGMLDELEGRYAKLTIHRLDVFALGTQVMQNPGQAGYRNVTAPCPTSARPGCEGYLFWDGLHPTAQAHGQLAQAALDVLQRGLREARAPGGTATAR